MSEWNTNPGAAEFQRNAGVAVATEEEEPSAAHSAPSMMGVNFSALFINRPVATFLLSVAIIIAGVAAYVVLPVSSMPEVAYPAISVSASLPGGDPETMASSVATPLERQFSRIAGINEMTSSSSYGSANIALQFDLTRDINGAARDVQAAINAARSQLPANLPSNPTYRKVNPSDVPILQIDLTSDIVGQGQLYDMADSILGQKIAQISGVGQVSIGGSAKPAVRIEANPMLLSSYGLGLEALRNAIGTVNVNQPKGYLSDGTRRYSISATDQLFGAAAYAPLIIATSKGPVSSATASSGLPANIASAVSTASTVSSTAPAGPTSGELSVSGIVRIRDVADVVDSVEDIHTGGRLGDQTAINISVYKAADANVIQTVESVRAVLPQLQASLPSSVKLTVVLDRTLTIRESVHDVTLTLFLSILLVILVVFLFLREIRSTLIPSVSVPLSLLGTFGVMYLLGYTIDNLSLMALTISTGFVVDDAIVVIENISRHLEDGMTPYEAAMRGSREIGFTVVTMSISLIAVFIPILLMGGYVGRLFREFAVTLSVAIMVSLVVSLTTTPMLSAKFLTSHKGKKQSRFYRWGEAILDSITHEYDMGLRWVLRHRPLVLLITVLTVVLNAYLFVIVPKGFFPEQDTGRLSGTIQAQQDISFDQLRTKCFQLEDIVNKDPAIEYSTLQIGGGGGNTARMTIAMKDTAIRRKTGDTADVVIARLRRKTAGIVGIRLFVLSPQDIKLGGRTSATQYQYSLTADSVTLLNSWAPRLMEEMQKLPQLKDIATDQQDAGLREQLVIDRDTASRLGVSTLTIDSTLSDAFAQRQVSTTYVPLNQYHVVMEVAQKYQRDPDALKNIYLKSTTGAMVPLTAVAHFENQRIPLTVNHQSLSPSATLSFNLTPGTSLSEATQAIQDARVRIGVPSDIHGGFAGTAQAFQASLASEPYLIALALTAVYIVLGILYESFIHPLTILSTLPSAGVGAILALLIFKVDLSVIAMIGIILLIGIVKKNAIMMIDFALVEEREHGRTPQEAIYKACLMRFRPIMMTTLAAMLGAIPLAIGTGTGSEMRQPLGITIVGGLLVSQCLTLFTTPVVYLFFDSVKVWFQRKSAHRQSHAMLPDAHPVSGD